jgi:hypothetical protein
MVRRERTFGMVEGGETLVGVLRLELTVKDEISVLQRSTNLTPDLTQLWKFSSLLSLTNNELFLDFPLLISPP